MTPKETLAQLEALGTEKMRAQNTKHGAGENQFGVRRGDARFLAILLIKPKKLSADEMDRMVRSVTFVEVADWLGSYVVKHHPDKETLRQRWMTDDDPMAARAGWSLTAERVAKSPEGLDLAALLDRIESEMGNSAPEAQMVSRQG